MTHGHERGWRPRTPIERLVAVLVAVLAVASALGMVLLWPSPASLSGPLGDPAEVLAAEVLAVATSEAEPDPLLEEVGGLSDLLVVTVRLLEGPDRGRVVELEVFAEGFPEFAAGDRVSLLPADVPGSDVEFFITDFRRLPALAWLVGGFLVAVVAVGRWHGVRSLLGLGISLLVVVRFIVPAILAGSAPATVALVGALAIMLVTLALTHGLNRMTLSAIAGTSGALVVTVIVGTIAIGRAKITGFASDEAVLATYAVEGLDLRGLVLAGLIIAALGVLDDVTVSQASTVFALHDADPRQSWSTLVGRAMRVGRDHIASVVNTLFLAYAGASLVLLVLFSTGGLPIAELVNAEVIAEEIVKTVVGSLGLVLAVPLTTGLAATLALAAPGRPDADVGTPVAPAMPTD
jgi:uncharacterized membrane protein